MYLLILFFGTNENCKLILGAEHNGEISLVMSSSMNEELLRIIHKSVDKFDLSPDETVTILKLLSRTLLKTKNIEPKKKFNKCADKDDNIFFECAIEGNANYIISRDKHLHDVKQKHKLVNSKGEQIQVLYPDEFVFELKKIKLVANFNNR